MKMCSLFDGSGGFPLAGVLCGIEPVMASEIEPYPIAVTRSRFPNMIHIGDVSKVNGAEITPVDLITFGSPCQDLSVAGKRAGLKHEQNGDEETTRSGLFMEAIRIIKEMREATDGKYPTFALWENVPGAFSSNKGEDFRIVLEEFIKIKEPTATVPAVGKTGWPYADIYVGEGWSIAYRTFDAQFWGVPQRRRRIYLVADFRGERAGKILFEREGLRGHTEKSRETRERTAGDAENGTGAADTTANSRTNPELSDDHEVPPSYTLKIRQGCEGGGKGALIQEELSATLSTLQDQTLFQPAGVLTPWDVQSRRIVDEGGIWPSLYSGEGGWHGYVLCKKEHEEPVVYNGENLTHPLNRQNPVPGDPCHTLGTDSRNYLVQTVHDSCILDDQGGQQISVRTDGKAPTLRAETHGNLPCVVETYGVTAKGNGEAFINPETHTALSAGGGLAGQGYPCVMQAAGFKPNQESKAQGMGYAVEQAPTLLAGQEPGVAIAYSVENHPNDSRVKIDETGKVQALTSRMGTGGGNVPMVIEPRVINLNKGDVQSKTILDPDGLAPSLYAGECRGGGGECYVLDKKPLCMTTQQGGAEIMEDKSPTITAAAGMSGNNQPVVCIEGNGSRPSHLGDGYKETDVMYTLNATEQHAVAMPIHDKATRHMGKHGDKNDGAGNGLGVGSDSDPMYTLTSGDHHAVCTDVGFFNSTEDVSTSLLARMYKDPPLVTMPNSECETQYIVRRLTPLECNRLQGFPDGWGETDPKEDFTDEEYQFWHEVRNTYASINGKKLQTYTKQQMLTWYNKLHTDSAEYKMWGNGIALPTALYVMEGIAEALKEQETESSESN